MADEPNGFTRRTAIRSAAVAAGFAWSAPAIRSIRTVASVGTPPPGSTSSTVPNVTTYTFEGFFEFVGQQRPATPPCDFENTVSVTVDLSGLGTSTVTIDSCFDVVNEREQSVLSELLIETADGSIRGTGRGLITRFETFIFTTVDFTITTGEGGFVGATGSAHFEAVLRQGDTASLGFLTGTFDVPI